MAKDKSVPSKNEAGKGSLSEAKTNEDFNKKKPSKAELEIKKVKK